MISTFTTKHTLHSKYLQQGRRFVFTFSNNSFLSGTCSASIHLIRLPDSQITHQALMHCVNRIIHLTFQNIRRNWQYPNVLSSPITQNPHLQYYENEWVILLSVCIFTVLHADLIMRQYFITAVPYIQHTHSQHMHFTHIHKYASISLSVCMHSTGKCWMMPIWVPWEHVQVIKHSSEPWGWRRMLSKSKTEFHTRFTVSEVWRKQNSRAQCCGRTEPPNGQTCLRLTTQQSHPPPTQTNAGKTGL